MNRVKKIRRRRKDGLQINRQQNFARKKVSRDVSVGGNGRVCEVSLGRREGGSYGEGGRRMRSCCPTTSQILRPTGMQTP